MNGDKQRLEIRPGLSIMELKQLITEELRKEAVPDQIKIIFAGQILHDDKTLKDYQIADHSTVHVIVSAAKPQSPPSPEPAPSQPSITTPLTSQAAPPPSLQNMAGLLGTGENISPEMMQQIQQQVMQQLQQNPQMYQQMAEQFMSQAQQNPDTLNQLMQWQSNPDQLQQMLASLLSQGPQSPPPEGPVESPEESPQYATQEKIDQIITMGFYERSMIESALQQSSGDVSGAVDILLRMMPPQ